MYCQTTSPFEPHPPTHIITPEPTHNLNMTNVPLVWPNKKLSLDPTVQLVVWGEQSSGVVFAISIFMSEESEYNQPLLLSEDFRNSDQLCRVKHQSLQSSEQDLYIP